MRVVLDTNVFVSGVFFSGPPARILEAWSRGEVTIVASPEILEEYYRVGRELRSRYAGVELQPALALRTPTTTSSWRARGLERCR